MNELEGSPNEEGTCMQIIPTSGSTDTLTHSQVTCSSDAHSHMTCSTETHSHGGQVETQQQPPLEKAAFVDGYLHGCSISTLAICQVMYASQDWTTRFGGK